MEGDAMEKSCENDLEILRLCPESEEALNELASTFIKILRTPKEHIKESERGKADMIVTWGRRIIKFGSCLDINQLSGIDCVESLYKNGSTDLIKGVSHFKETNDILNIGKYIIISCLSCEQKSCLLIEVARNIFHVSSEEEASLFLCQMWALRDEIPLTTEALEELIQGFPFCLEQFLMNIVEKVTCENSHDDIDTLINTELNMFCELCAKSSKLFQIVLSILHEFLLVSNVNESLFYFITSVFHLVERSCKKYDFQDLFPFEYRTLITFLQIEPSIYPEEFIDDDFSKNNVLNTLTHYILCNRRQGGALLSYYPEWLPYIYTHCVQNNVLQLIPKTKEDGERKQAYLKFILQSVM